MVSKEVMVVGSSDLDDSAPLIPEKYIRMDEKGIIEYVILYKI